MKAVLVSMLLLSASVCLAGGKRPFEKAAILFYSDARGTPLAMPKQLDITQKDIAKLLTFFPGLEKSKGSKPAGWTSRVVIGFFRKNEPPVTVRVNPALTIWTWGRQNGDFRPAPGFAEYLAKLEAKSHPLKKPG